MEAQANDKGYVTCPKCFDKVSKHAPACLDAGCPLSDIASETGVDAMVYPELARANLLRLRGSYEEAATTCRSILKEYPGNLTAHSLLGDIAAEQGDLKQAGDWYELALDIAPESQVEREKLKRVQDRLAAQEAADAARMLGLPTGRNKAKIFAVTTASFVTLVGVAGFYMGEYIKSKSPNLPPVVTAAIQIPNKFEPSQEKPPPAANDSTEPEPKLEPALTRADETSKVDAEALASIRARCEEGPRVTAAVKDVRTQALTITFSVEAAGSAKEIAAKLGASVLNEFTDCPSVVLRAVTAGDLIYIGDMMRGDLDAAVAASTDPDLESALRNEWFAQSTSGG